MPRKCLVPKQGNRRAGEDRGEDGPKAIHNDDTKDEGAGEAEAARWEDTQVLQQHAGFCEAEREVVNCEAPIEGLETGFQCWAVEVVDVLL